VLQTFEIVAEGGCEYLFVSGYSGVGKTVLIHEIYKPIVRQNGYFLEGKFDQFTRNIPYSALIQAFQGLVKQLLSESDESLEHWKNIILESVQLNGQIIIDVIPEVEMIIGKQPIVQEIGLIESENRFLYTFAGFIKIFAKKEHPLVVFLDDLQWIDIPTLRLIEHIVLSEEIRCFYLIGAYRNNEVDEGHRLKLFLNQKRDDVLFKSIDLQPLLKADVNHLIAEIVHRDLKSSAPLSSLVFAKTKGNPFFIIELLKGL